MMFYILIPLLCPLVLSENWYFGLSVFSIIVQDHFQLLQYNKQVVMPYKHPAIF